MKISVKKNSLLNATKILLVFNFQTGDICLVSADL